VFLSGVECRTGSLRVGTQVEEPDFGAACRRYVRCLCTHTHAPTHEGRHARILSVWHSLCSAYSCNGIRECLWQCITT
jgi:hypothetical protein